MQAYGNNGCQTKRWFILIYHIYFSLVIKLFFFLTKELLSPLPLYRMVSIMLFFFFFNFKIMQFDIECLLVCLLDCCNFQIIFNYNLSHLRLFAILRGKQRINNYYTCNKTNLTHKTSQQNGPHDSGGFFFIPHSFDRRYYRTVPRAFGVTGFSRGFRHRWYSKSRSLRPF